jgi:hypothetical protein
MVRLNPLQLISEWSGYLNNFPATVLLRIRQDDLETQLYSVECEMYWESQHAIDHKLETGMLWRYVFEDMYESETEAHRFAERWIRLQGFQFVKEVQ